MNLWTLQVEAPDYQAGRMAMLQALQATDTGPQPGPGSEDGVAVHNVAEGLLASDILNNAASPVRFLLATCDAITQGGLRVRGWPAPALPLSGEPTRETVRAILINAWGIYQGAPSDVSDEQLDAFLAHVMPGQPQGN